MSKIEEAVKLAKITSFLEKYKIKKATINKDFTVDVEDDVWLSSRNLNEISIQFGTVKGGFYCSYNNLTSLKGCPKYVGGNFKCIVNRLTTLEDAPEYVGGNFNCKYNSGLNYLKGIGKVSGIIYSDFFVGKLEDYNGEL